MPSEFDIFPDAPEEFDRFPDAPGPATATALPPSNWQPRPTLPPDEPQLDLQTRGQIQNYAPTQPSIEQMDQYLAGNQLSGAIGPNLEYARQVQERVNRFAEPQRSALAGLGNAPRYEPGSPGYDDAQQALAQQERLIRGNPNAYGPELTPPATPLEDPQLAQAAQRAGPGGTDRLRIAQQLAAGVPFINVGKPTLGNSPEGRQLLAQLGQSNQVFDLGNGQVLVNKHLLDQFTWDQPGAQMPAHPEIGEATRVGVSALNDFGTGTVAAAEGVLGNVLENPLPGVHTQTGADLQKQAQQRAQYGQKVAEEFAPQTAVGQQAVGGLQLAKDLAFGLATKGKGFMPAFAMDALSQGYSEAIRNGASPEDAAQKGMTSAALALLTASGQEAAVRQLTPALGGLGADVAANAALMPAQGAGERIIQGQDVRGQDLLGEAITGGLTGGAVRGVGMAAGRLRGLVGTEPPRAAEPGLIRPGTMQTPRSVEGDYGSGLGSPPDAAAGDALAATSNRVEGRLATSPGIVPQFAESDYGTGLGSRQPENVALRSTGEPAKPNEALTGAQNERVVPNLAGPAPQVPPAPIAARALEEGTQAPAGAGAGGEEAVGSHPVPAEPRTAQAGAERMSADEVRALGVPDEVIQKLEQSHAVTSGQRPQDNSGERTGDDQGGARSSPELGGGVSGRGEVSPGAQPAAEKVGYDVPSDLLGGVLQSSPTKAVYRGEGAEPAKPAEGIFARNVTRFRGLIDEGKRAAGKMFPTLNRLGESSGDAASHYVASKIYAKEAAPVIAHEVIGTAKGGKLDERVDRLAGAALVQDNLDTLRKERTAAGEDVSNMADLIGAEGSPFATRTDYALALKDPDVRAAIERYKAWFKSEADPNFRAAQGIAPGEDLPTRGEITGARVNLMAVRPEDPQTKTTVYGASRGNLTNVKLKPSPFARKAKGTGEGYEISLSKMIENTLGKGTEIANQHRLYEQLVKDKIAVIGKGGERPLIDGKPTRPLEIESARRFVTSQKGDEGTKTSGFTQPAKKLFIRADAYGEVYRAANVEEPFKIPVLTPLGTGLNKAALSSASEGMFHLANQLSVLVRTPGTGMVLPQMVKKGVQLWHGGPEVRKQLVELARIGALKEERPAAEGLAKLNPLGLMGKVIAATDRIGRLVVDDAFTKLAEKGIVENTEQNRRDLVNQFGQYNRRAQERFIAWLRDSNVNPFATAAANFSAIGWKNLTFSPGMKATSYANALRLRATLLARFAVPLAMVGVSNYLAWGRVDGSANIPIGSLRLPDDKDGKMRYVNVLDILGPTRGLRNSGLLAVIEGKRKGLSGSEIADKAGGDVWRGLIGPLSGPMPRQLSVAATGKELGGFQVAQTAEKGQSQQAENLKAAVRTANPLIDLMTGGRNTQFGKFEVKTANKRDESPAEMLADRLSMDRLKGLNLAPSDKAKHEAREKLVEAVRQNPSGGADLLRAAAEKGTIARADIGSIYQESRRDYLTNKVHRMELDDAMTVWDRANPKEQAAMRTVLLGKIYANRDKKPEEKRGLAEKVRSGGG